ncbi:TIGR03089 family protein [Knoellia locipacati]|uniref:Acyl-CoA synthetase n=1 Tax=Knoellia locipacati TaxID=882824 RepID=A0A512SWG2_9MICO|nr:TIGR03089 family protein [Knoellia locipacati]GEQ12296.1 acyl-CoA synthetase [Knoellia locipacati]
MTRPADVLQQMLRSDSAKPRITTYDDTDGPTRGERIELSARVLSNWVSKAANALQDEFDIAPGSAVHLDLPPHWRTAYWALATWSVGGAVAVGDTGGADLLVTTDPGAAATSDSPAVLVTLAGLARSAAVPVPPGVMDEARELSTHGDQFAAWEEPADDDPALVHAGGRTAYAALVSPAGTQGERRHLTTTDTADFLATCLALWASDGSVVLSRGEAPADVLVERSRVEGATGP